MGRLCDARVFEYHTPPSQNLRQRRRRASRVLRVRRSMRNVVQGSRWKVSGSARRDSAEDVVVSVVRVLRSPPAALSPNRLVPRDYRRQRSSRSAAISEKLILSVGIPHLSATNHEHSCAVPQSAFRASRQVRADDGEAFAN